LPEWKADLSSWQTGLETWDDGLGEEWKVDLGSWDEEGKAETNDKTNEEERNS
jgi:hypothetical protein